MIPFHHPASLGAPQLLSRTDLVQIIHRLQFEGWDFALRNDVNLNNAASEPYMNGRLFQGMVNVRNTLGLTNIFLVQTPGIQTSADQALPDREPDIILLIAEFGANEPHAVIECKRLDPLEPSRALRGDYVREGIDRFINSAYGPDHDLDFMVGYLLRANGNAAVADINAYLTNVDRPSCFLTRSATFVASGYVAESNHSRSQDSSRFRLLHSFVTFSDDQALPEV
jgi:hypothetical protein